MRVRVLYNDVVAETPARGGHAIVDPATGNPIRLSHYNEAPS